MPAGRHTCGFWLKQWFVYKLSGYVVIQWANGLADLNFSKSRGLHLRAHFKVFMINSYIFFYSNRNVNRSSQIQRL
jgi:hypothetical protein